VTLERPKLGSNAGALEPENFANPVRHEALEKIDKLKKTEKNR